MHGGAKGSGAPKENKNALKHGTYTKAAFDQRQSLREMVSQARDLLKSLPD